MSLAEDTQDIDTSNAMPEAPEHRVVTEQTYSAWLFGFVVRHLSLSLVLPTDSSQMHSKPHALIRDCIAGQIVLLFFFWK